MIILPLNLQKSDNNMLELKLSKTEALNIMGLIVFAQFKGACSKISSFKMMNRPFSI